MQNLHTTAMDGGSVENVGTIFNHYIRVENRIYRMFQNSLGKLNSIFKFILLFSMNPVPKLLQTLKAYLITFKYFLYHLFILYILSRPRFYFPVSKYSVIIDLNNRKSSFSPTAHLLPTFPFSRKEPLPSGLP